MKYLIIDTATSFLNIAIVKENEVLFKESKEYGKELSMNCVSVIEKAFKSCSLEPKDIDKIFISVGPGSYTGLRVGTTIAKVMGYSLNKEIIPLSSLKINALGVTEADFVISVLDARRGNVFGAIYDKNYKEIFKEKFVSFEELFEQSKKLDGKIKWVGVFDKTFVEKIVFNPEKIIEIYKDSEATNVHELKPNYLKKVEAEENLKVNK